MEFAVSELRRILLRTRRRKQIWWPVTVWKTFNRSYHGDAVGTILVRRNRETGYLSSWTAAVPMIGSLKVPGGPLGMEGHGTHEWPLKLR